MRARVFDTLSGWQPLVDMVGTRIYQANTRDTTPETPYIVFRVGVETPRIAVARTTSLQVWAHDSPGSYVRIDQMLKEMKAALEAMTNTDGLFAAEWLDDSEDLVDDASVTFTRYSRYQLINR